MTFKFPYTTRMKSGKITGAYIKTKSLEEIMPPPPPEKAPPQDDKKIAKEAKAKRRELKQALLTLLHTNHPIVFTEDKPKPLAVRMHHAIATLYPQFSGVIIRKVLKKWVNDIRYLTAVINCPSRHNLNGNVSGLVSESEREYAQELIDKRAVKLLEKQQPLKK